MDRQTGGHKRAALFLLLAMVVAGFASAAVYGVLQESRRQLELAQTPPETFPVVIATRDLSMGIPIGIEDVAVREVLPDMVASGLAFASLEEVVGRTPRERILSNEMIRTERLARRDAGIGLNALITPGKRAMSFQTSVATSVGGFIRPGNFVDVLVTIAPAIDELEADFLTQTILQQVKVLAVGATLERAESEPKDAHAPRDNSVTVELTLEEAEKLALAVAKGTLYVVLRSDVDITSQLTEHWTDIPMMLDFAQVEKPLVPATRKKPVIVAPEEDPLPEVIQGPHRDKVKLGTEPGF